MTPKNHHLQRILVSEKELNTLNLFENVFGKHRYHENLEMGFHVTLCSRTGEAIRAFESAITTNNPYSIAFIDMECSEDNVLGLDIAETLRHLDPCVEIVLMAHKMIHGKSLEKAHEKHPPDKICHLSKPCNAMEIFQLACVLGGKWIQEKRLNNVMGQLKKNNRDTTELNHALSLLTDSMKKKTGGSEAGNRFSSVLKHSSCTGKTQNQTEQRVGSCGFRHYRAPHKRPVAGFYPNPSVYIRPDIV